MLINRPSASFLISSTDSYVRILMPPTHPALPELKLGCRAKVHKATTHQHLQVYTDLASDRRSDYLTEHRSILDKIPGRMRFPILTKEDMFELTFYKSTGEIAKCTDFHQTICSVDAQHYSEGLWLFGLPHHRRRR